MLAVEVFGQDREFIAAQARHDVGRAHVASNAARNLHQEFVACSVPQAVVDQLEAVEIEKHQTEMSLRIDPDAVQRLNQVLMKTAAVRQARQGVVERDVVQVGLGLPARSDVLHLQDQARSV